MGRTKVDRLRGKRTHGHGNTKNARGSGCTGGKGRAGSHKHKFSKYYVDFGQRVTLMAKEKETTITLESLSEIIKDRKEIDLKELGFDKILGKGSINKAVIFKNAKATEIAKEKIEKAGGKIQ
ncbi:MAG: uL15 family ribosomal protein [archaeon]|jgi:large subunit ribosomal protein L15